MPWATAEIMVEEATAAMDRGAPVFDLVEQLMTSLAARVARAPRAAVLRVTGHWSRLTHTGTHPDNAKSFGEAFEGVVRYGVASGELPAATDAHELADLLQAVTMDALVGWAATDQSAALLAASLCRRGEILLRGAASSYS
jgi:hypothetical protein